MDGLGQYVVSVTAAAIIAGVLTGLVGNKGAAGALIRLLSGLFLTFVVIHPLVQLDFGYLEDLSYSFHDESSQIAADGEKMADEAMGDIIKSNVEAYILDKAETYDAQLSVEVTLDDDGLPVPAAVQITGEISPYGKRQMQKVLTEDLGIPEENQTWIG